MNFVCAGREIKDAGLGQNEIVFSVPQLTGYVRVDKP